MAHIKIDKFTLLNCILSIVVIILTILIDFRLVVIVFSVLLPIVIYIQYVDKKRQITTIINSRKLCYAQLLILVFELLVCNQIRINLDAYETAYTLALNDRISNVRIVKRNGFTTIDLNNGKSIKFFPTNYDRMTKIIDNNCINDSIFKKPNNDTIIISHQNAYEYIIISKPQHLNYIQ